jgi:hypothetical protein
MERNVGATLIKKEKIKLPSYVRKFGGVEKFQSLIYEKGLPNI